MLDIFNLEKQAGKRVKNLLLHKSTAAGIDATTAKFVLNIRDEKVTVHLYSNNKAVHALELKEIAEFFGKEYDPTKVAPFYEYIIKLAEGDQIQIANLNVIICENKQQMGCHLYNETKYVKRIPTLELLNKFNAEND